jgi:hypothetical protein
MYIIMGLYHLNVDQRYYPNHTVVILKDALIHRVEFIGSLAHFISSFIHPKYHALQMCTGKVREKISNL